MIANRIGIIDIGTNTFNLLVVDKLGTEFQKVLNIKEGVGLGFGGINDGIITAEAMKRGRKAIVGFLHQCNELEVSKVKAFGTSAMRDATNRDEFIRTLEVELDLEVEVISGQREAELIYQGVTLGYPFESPALIMDIGGGSTEFIYANAEGVIKANSFDIGTSRIYQTFEFEDPYSEKNVRDVLAYLEKNTNGFFDNIKSDILIGASGSFETFYAILNQREYPENEFEDMGTAQLFSILDDMIYSTFEERMKNQFIIPIRKTMAPIAAIKIKWIFEKLGIKTLTISPFAMKEGLIKLM